MPTACKDLTYIEFFAGQGEVFRAIRADHHPAVAVDITYMQGTGHAMDINSDSGLAFLGCVGWLHALIIQFHSVQKKHDLTISVNIRNLYQQNTFPHLRDEAFQGMGLLQL